METRRTGTGISQLRYLHKDILGSITAVSDDYGRVSTELEYSPFGELISGSAGSLGNFGFTGQEWDNDITMYHFPARYYEPLWGRFMTPDPWTGMPDDERNLVVQQYVPRTPDIYIALASPQYPGEHMSINKPNPAVLNFYPYVVNYPVNKVDPYGLFEKNPKDSYSECYEKCLNSPEVERTQELAQKFVTYSVPAMGLLTGASEIYTKGAVPFVLLFGKKLEGVTIPLAEISMLKACGWIARYIKFLNKASLVATAGSLSFYSFTGDWSNIYCVLICAGGGGY